MVSHEQPGVGSRARQVPRHRRASVRGQISRKVSRETADHLCRHGDDCSANGVLSTTTPPENSHMKGVSDRLAALPWRLRCAQPRCPCRGSLSGHAQTGVIGKGVTGPPENSHIKRPHDSAEARHGRFHPARRPPEDRCEPPMAVSDDPLTLRRRSCECFRAAFGPRRPSHSHPPPETAW
jgi:hypothetical protein